MRLLAHLGPLRLGHGELPREADVAAQRADLVLVARRGLRQIEQHRRGVDASSTRRARGCRCPATAGRSPCTAAPIVASALASAHRAQDLQQRRVRGGREPWAWRRPASAAHASRSGMRTQAARKRFLRDLGIVRILRRDDLRDQHRKLLGADRLAQRRQRGAANRRVRIVERLDERRRGVDPPLADELDQHRQRSSLRPSTGGRRFPRSPSRPASSASAALAACASSASDSAAISSSVDRLDGVAHAADDADGRDPHLLGAALGRLRAPPRAGTTSLRSAKRHQQQRRPIGRRAGQLGRQGLGDFAAGQLAGRAQADLEQRLVRTSGAARPTAECRRSCGPESRRGSLPGFCCLGTSALRTSS